MDLDVRIVKKDEPEIVKMSEMKHLDIGVIVDAKQPFKHYNELIVIALWSEDGSVGSWYSLGNSGHSWEKRSEGKFPPINVKLLQPGEQLVIERKED